MREENVIPMPERCPACGCRREDGEHRCQKCGRRFTVANGAAGPLPLRSGPPLPHVGSASPQAAAPQRVPQEPAFPEPLRQHLRSRVERFRMRRHNPSLPFDPVEEEIPEVKIVPIRPLPQVAAPQRKRTASANKPRSADLASGLQEALHFPAVAAAPVPLPMPQIAPFRLRARGNLLDCVLVMAATLLFLAPCKLLAGSLMYPRLWLALGAGAGLLLALLYGVIFLYLAGATPGMKAEALTLVNFDGLPASSPQRLIRLLGAVVSGGSFFLGFLWAAVDEEGLSWHDRISRTFLTSTPH